MNLKLPLKCVTCIFYKMCNSTPVPYCDGNAYYPVDTIRAEKKES